MVLPVRFLALNKAITGGKRMAFAKIGEPPDSLFIIWITYKIAITIKDTYIRNSPKPIFSLLFCSFTASSINVFPFDVVLFMYTYIPSIISKKTTPMIEIKPIKTSLALIRLSP